MGLMDVLVRVESSLFIFVLVLGSSDFNWIIYMNIDLGGCFVKGFVFYFFINEYFYGFMGLFFSFVSWFIFVWF